MLRDVLDVFYALCNEVATPFAYKASLLARRADWARLTRLECRPGSYTCSHTYALDAQVHAFFKKMAGLDTGVDLKDEALKTFFQCEAACYRSNERLSPLLFDEWHYGSAMADFVRVWRKHIRRVLGARPTLSTLENGRFGPNATFANRGDAVMVTEKLSDFYTATFDLPPACLKLWDETAWSRYAACGLIGDDVDFDVLRSGGWYQAGAYAIRDISRVRGNRFTSVPKDSKKDRGICVEPSLNGFFQLSVGDEISSRLRSRLGWDKRRYQEFQRERARQGSIDGSLSTIDLSNASDTICTNLIKLVLPRPWFDLLDRLRSRMTRVKSKWVKLEKFSSMGNGFTFELETLVFWTMASALSECLGYRDQASVFGDDIIVGTEIAPMLVRTLAFFGLEANVQKTFVSGPFRESCGGDFWNGRDVRPSSFKEIPCEPHQWIAFANGLDRFIQRTGVGRKAWFRVVSKLPSHIRSLRGPRDLGDVVIADDNWIVHNPMVVRNSVRYLRVWRPVTNRKVGFEHYRPGVVLASALYGAISSASSSFNPSANPTISGEGVVPRLRGSYVSGYRRGRIAYS